MIGAGTRNRPGNAGHAGATQARVMAMAHALTIQTTPMQLVIASIGRKHRAGWRAPFIEMNPNSLSAMRDHPKNFQIARAADPHRLKESLSTRETLVTLPPRPLGTSNIDFGQSAHL